MAPYLRRLAVAAEGGPLIGMHMRTGFADWQWYSRTGQAVTVALPNSSGSSVDSMQAQQRGTSNVVRQIANHPWAAAAASKPMRYARHWRTFEAMLHDCTDPMVKTGAPCFNW